MGLKPRATARRRQPPHSVGRPSPSAIALFLLSKKGKQHVRRAAACLSHGVGSVVLTLDELKRITNNFSHDQLLGEGTFGKVYKGVRRNGDTIAVKRFASTIIGLQDGQYENEAQHLMRFKHQNILQLVGYCSETEIKLVRHNGTFVRAEQPERLLCLEYMPKGSLRDHLSDETCGLEWNTRYKIIQGICCGLHYLHEWWQATPIIHMDLKPANILLDDNMAPKIADFGLSRLFGEEQTRTCTTSCKGTPGYMPPEYLEKGVITKTFDIFSLGVIIIEIITGGKDYPTDETETTSQQYIDLVLNNWRHRLTKAQGYTSQDIDYQQIKKCIQIALLCVKSDQVKRPTINQIMEMLERLDEAYQNERKAHGRRGAGDNIFDAINAAITVDAAAAAAGQGGAAGGTPTAGAPTPAQLHPESAASVPSLCSSDRAEAIVDDGAPRCDDPVLAETERIKAVLLNDQEEKSESELLELLRRLQELDLAFDTLDATAIGKAVANFRKHSSKQIRNLVRSLFEDWKHTVDVWAARRREAAVDQTPQSMGPSSLEQEDRGAASSHMEEGVLFATPRYTIRLSEENPGSKFSDGMNGDGGIMNNASRDFVQRYPMNHEPVRRPPAMGQHYDPEPCWRQEQSAPSPRQSRPQELSNGQTEEQFVTEMFARRSSNVESGPGRPQARPRQHPGPDASPAQGRSQSAVSEKPVAQLDANSVRAKLELAKNAKLEATKRKLQEGYQEFDNAKKQRNIQIVDAQNLPKQGNNNRNFQPWNNSSSINWLVAMDQATAPAEHNPDSDAHLQSLSASVTAKTEGLPAATDPAQSCWSAATYFSTSENLYLSTSENLSHLPATSDSNHGCSNRPGQIDLEEVVSHSNHGCSNRPGQIDLEEVVSALVGASAMDSLDFFDIEPADDLDSYYASYFA